MKWTKEYFSISHWKEFYFYAAICLWEEAGAESFIVQDAQ